MAIYQEFDLNLIPDSAPVVVKCDQYDEGTGRLKISLFDGETPYTPASGATVTIQGTKPDLHAFTYQASFSGNLVTANLTQQMTAVAGRTRVQIVVTESGNRTGTFVFWLEVQQSALQDDAIISDSEVGDLIDLARHNAETAVNAANSATNSALSAANSAALAVNTVANMQGYVQNASNYANNASNSANNASTYASQANADAILANTSASSVVNSALDSEAWAVGQRAGVNVPSSDETYHNNSKYWAEQAQQSATGVNFDVEPMANSLNAVYSNGIYYALQNVSIDIDAVPTDGSPNAVSSNGVYHAVQNATGVSDYYQLSNKPVLNSVTINGTQNLDDFGIQPEEFIGTTAEWNALTTAQKSEYNLVNLTDDDASSPITIDSAMSSTSANAVQNRVVYAAIQNAGGGGIVDSEFNASSNNPLQNRVLTDYLKAKQLMIGYNASMSGYLFDGEMVIIGSNASANSRGSICIGPNSSANTAATAIGQNVISSQYSVAIGHMANATGLNAVVIGYDANVCNSENSIAIGRSAKVRPSLNSCVVVGEGAEALGNNATAVGTLSNGHSYDTVSVGYRAYSESFGVAVGSLSNAYASRGIAIGYNASINSTSYNAVAIGDNASIVGSTNSMALGHNASVTTANTIQLGDSGISSLKCAVQLTVTSDERDKADIEDMEGALELVENLHPVTYVRNPRDAYAIPEEKLSEKELEKRQKYGLYKYDKKEHKKGTKKGTRRRVGLLAQEVQESLRKIYGSADVMNLVDSDIYDYEDVPKDVEGQLSIAYANFVPILIKAIQELSIEMEELKGATINSDSKV